MNYLQNRLEAKKAELLLALEVEEDYWTQKIENAGNLSTAQEKFFRRQIEHIDLVREYLALEVKVYAALLEDYERLKQFLNGKGSGASSDAEGIAPVKGPRTSSQKEKIRFDSIMYSDWVDNI